MCVEQYFVMNSKNAIYQTKQNRIFSAAHQKILSTTSELKFFEKSCVWGAGRGYWVGEDRNKKCGFKNSLLFLHFLRITRFSVKMWFFFFHEKLYNVPSKEVSWAFFSTENWPIRDKPSVLDEYLDTNFKNSYVQKVSFFLCQNSFILEGNYSGQFLQANMTKGYIISVWFYGEQN